MHLSKCSVYYSKRNIIYQKTRSKWIIEQFKIRTPLSKTLILGNILF